MAGLSDEQIVMAGSSDEQIVMAGSSRKRKNEKPIDNTIKILSEDHYEVQQFLENIPANTLKDRLVTLRSISGSNCKKIILNIDEQKLTAVLPSGLLDIKLTFYIAEQHFIEMEESRFLDNPHILWRLPAEDNSNNNTTIGINLLYKEKAANDKNLKEDILAVAWLIYHLRIVQDRLPINPPMMQPNYDNKKYIQNLQEYYDNYLEKGMEFDGSKIKGAISLTKNIDDDHNSRINFLDKVDDGNMSLYIEDMLTILDEIKSEDETSELSRRRNVRRYLYFYELYKKTLETVASEPKSFAEKINKLWNICNKSFVIFDLITGLTSNLFERLLSRESAERWFIIIKKGIYYIQQEYRGIQKQQQEEKEVTNNDSGNSSNNSENEGQGSGNEGQRSENKGQGSGKEREAEDGKVEGKGDGKEEKEEKKKEKGKRKRKRKRE
ncbi:hypothetical protein RclHR1_08960001 [Rhizophagus clarus]|uniref:Uncharacterized protein n=1 Tax=Rhizophagus clarus TaxID=94130 RepID=A0A2Z6S2Q6_9GLOM|nr:hypothetical protein RclHR1_08960001 [Rhizophagus clarus]